MRIALYHNLPSGGAKRTFFEFAKQFRKNGHDIDLYILDSADESFLSIKNIANNVYKFKFLKFSRENSLLSFLNFFFSIFDILSMLLVSKKIAKEIDKKKYDFVFISNCHLTQNPCILRYSKSRKVLYSQEPLRYLYEKNIRVLEQSSSRLKRLLFDFLFFPYFFILKRIDSYNIEKADLVLVNSYFSRESFIRAYNIYPIVSYLGVDIAVFKNLNIKKENIVLSIGALSKFKAHDFIIDSISKIKGIRPELIIISDRGSENDKSYLLDKAQKLNVKIRILFKISEEELIKYYNKALLTTYASIMEPLGLVVLESFACGTPVLGIKEGGMRETIIDGYNGYATDRDINEFSQKLEKMLTDKNYLFKLGNNAEDFVNKNFTWDIAYKSLFEKINKLVLNDRT